MRPRRSSTVRPARTGETSYAAALTSLGVLEAAGIAAVVWYLIYVQGATTAAAGRYVVGAATIVALSIALLACAALVRHTVRSRRSEAEALSRLAWSDRWIDVVFSDAEPPPPGPLTQPAIESLLDLRESLVGEPADMVSSLVRDYGVDTGLIERLEGSAAHRGRFGQRLERRLDALEELGRARAPQAVPRLIQAATDRDPVVRLMGIRALARSVSALGSEDERRSVAGEVAGVLHGARLSSGALAEAMELLGPAAPHIVRAILSDPNHYGNRMLVAALDAVGRMGLDAFTEQVVASASSRRTSVRLSALHALTKLERLPVAAASIIQRAFRDRDEKVRIEAARAARLLEPKTAIAHLEELLCDPDWTVRRVAATTLAGLGGPGLRTLIATSLVHGDPRARSVATQVLVESRSPSELDEDTEKVG